MSPTISFTNASVVTEKLRGRNTGSPWEAGHGAQKSLTAPSSHSSALPLHSRSISFSNEPCVAPFIPCRKRNMADSAPVNRVQQDMKRSSNGNLRRRTPSASFTDARSGTRIPPRASKNL